MVVTNLNQGTSAAMRSGSSRYPNSPGAASSLQTIKLVIAGHGIAAVFPILVHGACVTDKRGDSGDCGEEQMLGAAAFDVDREAALGDLTAEHGVAQFQFCRDAA